MGAAASASGEAYKVEGGAPMGVGDVTLPSADEVEEMLQATMGKEGGVDAVRTFIAHVEMVLGKCKSVLEKKEAARVSRKVGSCLSESQILRP